jgi:hypothetical protein
VELGSLGGVADEKLKLQNLLTISGNPLHARRVFGVLALDLNRQPWLRQPRRPITAFSFVNARDMCPAFS